MANQEKFGSGTAVRRGTTRRMLLMKDVLSITGGASGTNSEVYGSGTKVKRSDQHRLLLAKELKIINAGAIGGGFINENFGKGTTPWRRNTLRQLEAKTIIAMP